METKMSRERNFSVELNSKSDLKSVAMMQGPRENVVVEGSIGELIQIGFIEGIILEVIGDKGVLRIDLDEEEVTRIPRLNQTASIKTTKVNGGGEING